MYCGCTCKTLFSEGNTCPGCGMIMTTDKRVDRLLRIIEKLNPAAIVRSTQIVSAAIPEIISGQMPRQNIPEVFMARPQFADPLPAPPVENAVSEAISDRAMLLVKLGLMRGTVNETPRWSFHPTNGVPWSELHILQQEAIRLEHPTWSDIEVGLVRWNGPAFTPAPAEATAGLRKAKLCFALCLSSREGGRSAAL